MQEFPTPITKPVGAEQSQPEVETASATYPAVSGTDEPQFVRADCVISGVIDGQLFLTNIDTGKYHYLNPTAAYLWEQLEHPRRLAELVQALTNQFTVNQDTAKRAALRFIDEMKARQSLQEIPKAS
jgi:hypothetical protein